MHESSITKVIRNFLFTAGVLLLLTGAAKIISTFGSGGVLAMYDPILGVRFRELYLFVGAAEIGVGFSCLHGKQIWTQAVLLFSLALSFAVYRAGLAFVGYKKPCSCLGSLTDAINIPPESADLVMKVVLAYLLIGSCITLFLLFKSDTRTRLVCGQGADSDSPRSATSE